MSVAPAPSRLLADGALPLALPLALRRPPAEGVAAEPEPLGRAQTEGVVAQPQQPSRLAVAAQAQARRKALEIAAAWQQGGTPFR